jgi:hypothetical protein
MSAGTATSGAGSARSRCCGPGEDGRVRVATAWHVDTGFGSAAGDLRNMVRDGGVL